MHGRDRPSLAHGHLGDGETLGDVPLAAGAGDAARRAAAGIPDHDRASAAAATNRTPLGNPSSLMTAVPISRCPLSMSDMGWGETPASMATACCEPRSATRRRRRSTTS